MTTQTARRYHLEEAGVTIEMGGSPRPVPSVLVFDKNPLFCEVLSRQLTKPGAFNCIGCAEESDLIDILERHRPALLVVDPDHLSIEHIHEIPRFSEAVHNASPDTRIIGYSFALTSSKVRAALEAGFRGCISKSVELAGLKAAMTAVLHGGLFIDESLGPVLTPLTGGKGKEDDQILSDREREVLIMIAQGQGTKQIAYDLNISVKTVDTYKARAVQKLGLKSRAHLVQYAIKRGWLN